MIAELNESNRPQFLAAVRGRPYFGDILPVHLAVFGRSGALMRFYVADGSAAVQLKGRSAVLCGTYDAEETGAFLRMQGVRYVNAGGAAEVWAVRREGALVSTAGAYALSPDTAYLAAVETLEALRGQGIGGWLTGLLAADLAARGRRVALSCKKERLNFYHRLGFAAEDTVQRYALDGLPEEK